MTRLSECGASIVEVSSIRSGCGMMQNGIPWGMHVSTDNAVFSTAWCDVM